MSRQYDEYLRSHIENVRKATLWIVENLSTELGLEDRDRVLLKMRATSHDKSKWGVDEYGAYDEYFYGEADEKAFNLAWLHHIHNNKHHWQHWLLMNDDGKYRDSGKVVPLEMPEVYVLEMIADWWSFSWRSGNLREMFGWYEEHKDCIILHQSTREYVESVLGMIREKLESFDPTADGASDDRNANGAGWSMDADDDVMVGIILRDVAYRQDVVDLPEFLLSEANRLGEENDRLRELVRELHYLACIPDRESTACSCMCVRGADDKCAASDECWYERQMRECGIDVSETASEQRAAQIDPHWDTVGGQSTDAETCHYNPDDTGFTWWDDNDVEHCEEDSASDDCGSASCDKCGYSMMVGDCGWFNGWDEITEWWEEDGSYHKGYVLTPTFKFCPNCGRKVTRA